LFSSGDAVEDICGHGIDQDRQPSRAIAIASTIGRAHGKQLHELVTGWSHTILSACSYAHVGLAVSIASLAALAAKINVAGCSQKAQYVPC
jgi:hypothetical protein